MIFFKSGDLTKFKETPIEVKEGTQYRLKVVFRVQREIVAGLRYFQQTYRKGIKGGCVFMVCTKWKHLAMARSIIVLH